MLNRTQRIKKDKKVASKKSERDKKRKMLKHLVNYKSRIKKIIEMHKAEDELREMVKKNKEEENKLKV